MLAYRQTSRLHEKWLQCKALAGALFLYALIVFLLIVPSRRGSVTTVIIDPHAAAKPVLFLSNKKGSGKRAPGTAAKKNSESVQKKAELKKAKEVKKQKAQKKEPPAQAKKEKFQKAKVEKKIEKSAEKKIIEPVKKIVEPEPVQEKKQVIEKETVKTQEPAPQEITPLEEVTVGDEGNAEQLGRIEKAHYALSRAVARVWNQPRVTVKKPVKIIVSVNAQGKAEELVVEEQSGVPAYDIAARAAVLRTDFPQEFFGKQIALVFGSK